MLARLMLILGTVAIVAHADTIFSTFGPGNSYSSNVGWLIGGILFGGTLTTGEAALSFVPTTDYTFAQIDVAVLRESGNGPLDLYLTSGSTIGNPIESFQITTIDSSPGIYSVTSVVKPVLNGGTNYWLVLTADPTDSNFDWLVSPNSGSAATASIFRSALSRYAVNRKAGRCSGCVPNDSRTYLRQ
jgi:hypothetical protein